MISILNIDLSDEEKFLVKVLTRDYLDCDVIRFLYQSVGDEKLFKLCEHNKIGSIQLMRLFVAVDKKSLLVTG